MDFQPHPLPRALPESRSIIRWAMWTCAWLGLLSLPASLQTPALLVVEGHGRVARWVTLTPWLLLAAALIFGTISQIEDIASRRRVVAGMILASAFPMLGVLIHYAAPSLRFPALSGSGGTVWMFYWVAQIFGVNPFNGAGPWVDRWLVKWLGAPDESPSVIRAREKAIREAASQEERNRLAQDLHDSIKQEIFAIHTNAATIQARLETDPAGARTALEQIRNSARDAMTEMEALLDRLNPTPLENTGLVAALKKQCEALALRTGAQVECDIGPLPDQRGLPPGVHEAFFRIAQEALSNVGKHARAVHVHVSLGIEERDFQLMIEDDGQGFDSRAAIYGDRKGMGLGNMQTRAASVGARIDIAAAPGGGTTITVGVPILLGSVAFGSTSIGMRWLLAFMIGFPAVFLLMAAAKAAYAFDPTLLAMIIIVMLLKPTIDYAKRRWSQRKTSR